MILQYRILQKTIFLSFCAILCASASADEEQYSPTVTHRVVRVGTYPKAGYHDYSGERLSGGYGYDYLQQLDNYAPWAFRFTGKEFTWPDMLPMLESGEIDLLTNVHKTPDREAKFAFSNYPAGYSATMLSVKAGNGRFAPGDYAHWNGMCVGMLTDNGQNEKFRAFAEAKGFSFQAVYYDTLAELLDDLHAGKRIDAAFTSDLRKVKDEWILEKTGLRPFYIAVRKHDSELLAELNAAQEKIIRNCPAFLEKLHKKYYADSKNELVSFDAEEKEFIRRMKETHHVFTAVLNPDRYPISFLKDGEHCGLLKDIAEEIIRRTGLDIRLKTVKTREEYYRACASDEIDLVFDLLHDYSMAGRLNLHLVSPYFTSQAVILHRKNRAGGFRSFATIGFSNMPDPLKQQFAPDAQVVTCSSIDEAVNLVRSGECEATYLHAKSAEYVLLDDNTGQLAIQYMPSLNKKYGIAIRNTRNPLLFSILEKVSAGIGGEFIEQLSLRYDAKFVPRDSLETILHKHLWMFLVSAVSILLLCAVMLWLILRSARRLRKEKSFLKLILKSVDDGLVATDLSGNIRSLNPAAERMIGISHEHAMGKPVDDVFTAVDPRNGTPLDSLVRKALLTDRAVELDGNAALRAANGESTLRIEYAASPIHSDTGERLGALLVFRDITDECRRQEELKAEISQWNAVSTIARIYRFQFDYKTRAITGNIPADIWPVKNGIAVPATGWVYPDDLKTWKKRFAELVSGKSKQFLLKHRIFRDGKMHHFRVFMQMEDAADHRISGVVQEITDIMGMRQKQEAALQLWQTCLDSMPFMLSVKSAENFRYLQCNESFARFFGKTPDRIAGLRIADLFEPGSEFAEKMRESDKAVLAGGTLQTFHETGTDHAGRLRYVLTVKLPTTDMRGKPILLCMGVDETEEYNRRMELQNLLENRDAAADLASVVAYRINFKTWKISGSNHLAEYWPITDGKALRASDAVIPEDVELCKQEYAAIIRGEKQSATIPYRRVKEDGLHYYRLHMRKDQNAPDYITGLIQDVTAYMLEQKKSEALINLWNAVANAIPAILFVKDADDDYRYLYANNNLGILLNRKPEELVGHAERDFIHADEADRIRKSDMEAMASGKKGECYELLRDANGVDHHFHSIKIPSVNEFGHRILIQMTTDVTELQELSEVRKIVSNAFENLFFTDDLERGISGILRHICEFVGYTRGYVCCVDHERNVIRLFATYIPSGEEPLFNDAKFKIVKATNQAWYRNVMESKQGDILDCDFNKPEDCETMRRLFPLVLEHREKFDIRGAHVQYLAVNGKPWGYIGFLTERANPKTLSENEQVLLKMAANIIELAVTRKRTFVNLQNAMDEAKAAAVAKSEFLATMSHEIRTPLNAVLGFTELLQDPRLDPSIHDEYLKNIADAGNLLLALINDILDLSKLSANKMKFVPAETSIETLFNEMEVCFRPRCASKNLRLLCDVPPDFPRVFVDASRIRQLLLNLIGNAVKFTEKGSITVRASFTKETDTGGTLRMSVADTGIGISESNQKQLFQPFSQATAILGTATANKGSGLGLSICKKMLECMDGRLSLESTLGKGSVFTAELRDVRYRTGAEPAKTVPDVTLRKTSDFSNLSALIVDDMPMNLLVLSAMLKKSGIDAVQAHNSAEALALLANRPFDCILTDLWMPGMNGVELARKIRKDAAHLHTRIAVVTADVEGKDHFDFSSFDAVLTKPVTASMLQHFLESCVK